MKRGKEVKITPGSKDFYLSICSYVKLHNKLPSAASIGLTKQALNYHLRKLKIEGIIQKVGYGTWEFNQKNQDRYNLKQVKITPGDTSKQVTLFTSFGKIIRGHGMIVTFKIPKIPNWDKREVYLERKNIKFRRIGSNWLGQSIKIRDFKVWLTPKSIVVYYPKGKSRYAETAEESERYLLYDITQVIKTTENLLKVSIKINGEYKFKVSKQHYAKVEDNLAKHYRRTGEKLIIANKGGIWCITDYSLKTDELEMISGKTAVPDTDSVVVPFLNDLKGYYEKTGETLTTSKVLEIASINTKNLHDFAVESKEYAEEIKRHRKAIEKMANLLEKIEKRLG